MGGIRLQVDLWWPQCCNLMLCQVQPLRVPLRSRGCVWLSWASIGACDASEPALVHVSSHSLMLLGVLWCRVWRGSGCSQAIHPDLVLCGGERLEWGEWLGLIQIYWGVLAPPCASCTLWISLLQGTEWLQSAMWWGKTGGGGWEDWNK